MNISLETRSIDRTAGSLAKSQEVTRLRVGHIVSTFCPISSTFLYGLAMNPYVDGAVFCRSRANSSIYPCERVVTRALSSKVRHIGNKLIPGCGSLLARGIFIWEWQRFLAVHRPQVLHAQYGNFAATLEPVKKSAIPLVVTFHGSDINTATYDRNYLSRLRQLFDRAAVCHFVSEDLRDYALSLGCDASKARTVYLGTPIPTSGTRYSDRIADCKFACVGRFIPCKGHETLLKAFKEVVAKRPTVELHLYGDGPLRDRLEWLIDNLGLRQHVHLHGETINAVILNRLASDMDVLILASQDDDTGRREGLPISLTEGAALGLPCVGTRCGGIPELIHDSESGMLVDQRSPAQLATAMLALADQPNLRERLGLRARDVAADKFNSQKQHAAVAQIYREALDF